MAVTTPREERGETERELESVRAEVAASEERLERLACAGVSTALRACDYRTPCLDLETAVEEERDALIRLKIDQAILETRQQRQALVRAKRVRVAVLVCLTPVPVWLSIEIWKIGGVVFVAHAIILFVFASIVWLIGKIESSPRTRPPWPQL